MDEEEARQKGYEDGKKEKEYRESTGAVGVALEAISGTFFDPPEEFYDEYKQAFYDELEED